MHPDAKRWNQRYREETDKWLVASPRPLLTEHAHLLPERGLALDAAAGSGAHGLFLAQRGLHVIALDISEAGLRLARQRAWEEGVWVDTAVYNLAHPWFPPHSFTVITNFRFLERDTFPAYRRALQPGGLLFFETFLKAGELSGPPEYYLEPGELEAAFTDFEILHNDTHERRGEDGRLLKVSQRLIARKPPTP